jgi:hypothetical protein
LSLALNFIRVQESAFGMFERQQLPREGGFARAIRSSDNDGFGQLSSSIRKLDALQQHAARSPATGR